MAARSLQQVLTELNSVYQPQVNQLRQQQASLPNQLKADEQGLAAQQTQAFDEILNGARRRGLGWSGIPEGEQAKYNATQYMPALAHLKQSTADRATSLEQAILGLNQQKMTQGQDIFQNERQFYEDQRLNNEKMQLARQQAAASAFSPTLGYRPGAASAPQQRKDGGFNFTDMNGRPISAAAYAYATRTPFRDVLQTMAKAGDKGAQTALGFVGNDYGYDPNKLNNPQLANIYNALTWGVAKQAPTRFVNVAKAPTYNGTLRVASATPGTLRTAW